MNAADRPATQHDVPATSYSHPPSNESPSALLASLERIQSLLDATRTATTNPEGTQQNNNYVVATSSAALPPTRSHNINNAAAPADHHDVSHNVRRDDITLTTGAAQSKMDTAPTTSPPSSHPSNPYEAWDPRHESFDSYHKLRATSYLIAAQTSAEKEEAAASILTRWLAQIVFKRKLQRRLTSRKRVKHRSHVASVFLQSVLLPDIMDNTSSATAPSPLFNTPSPRKQHSHYPTLAEKHPFRQRGMTLPPLSSKRKRRCRRRCFRRYHQTRTRGTPRSTSNAQNPTTSPPIIHPTRACPHCPAFFHHQSDLDDHVILCKPVATVASSEPTLAADAVLSRDDAPSPPVQVASPLTTHVPSADAALSTAEATSFPSSHPIQPTTPEGGAVKTTDRDPSSTTLEAPPASIITDHLHHYPYLSSPEDVLNMYHTLSALRQLLPSDLPIITNYTIYLLKLYQEADLYLLDQKRIGGPPPD